MHIFLNNYDISTITIENMPGGTPWGQAQLCIFDRKFLPALKITKLVFFFLYAMKFDTRVKLIYFNQFYRQYENRDIHVEDSEIHV
jgi:hypothetical protein